MRGTRIALVILVVAALILAFYVFVGVNVAASNIGEDEDPTGQGRDPIQYVVVNIDATVQNMLGHINGAITDVSIEVFDWISAEEARVTTNEKLDLMAIFGEDDVVTWVKCTITGPGNYNSVWESEKFEDEIPEVAAEGDTRYYDFGPYTADFYDPGTYTLTVSLLMECDTEDTNSPVTMSESFVIYA